MPTIAEWCQSVIAEADKCAFYAAVPVRSYYYKQVLEALREDGVANYSMPEGEQGLDIKFLLDRTYEALRRADATDQALDAAQQYRVSYLDLRKELNQAIKDNCKLPSVGPALQAQGTFASAAVQVVRPKDLGEGNYATGVKDYADAYGNGYQIMGKNDKGEQRSIIVRGDGSIVSGYDKITPISQFSGGYVERQLMINKDDILGHFKVTPPVSLMSKASRR